MEHESVEHEDGGGYRKGVYEVNAANGYAASAGFVTPLKRPRHLEVTRARHRSTMIETRLDRDLPGGVSSRHKVHKTARSTILVVDDEPEICELVSYNLAREGYRVLTERDGEAGLERIFKSPPDLLILDLLLPKLSGLEVLQSLRAEPRTKSLPVLVLSARGTEMDKL